MAERKSLLRKGEVREPLSPISQNQASTRTPRKKKSTNNTVKTPSGKTPNVKSLSLSNTDGISYDRFIPNRALMNNEVSTSDKYYFFLENFFYECRIWRTLTKETFINIRA